MALHLTPDILQASYELLRMTLPFRRWKLPNGDAVEFHVIGHKNLFADCKRGPRKIIRVSNVTVQTLATLIETMAHEMIHLHDTSRAHHGRAFQKHADQICKRHGFERGRF